MTVIAIDYTPAYEQGAGIGRYVRELTAALAKLDHETDYRLFIAGATDLPPALAENFTWKPTNISPKWLARIWHRAHMSIPVEVITGEIDLYHATDFVLPPTRPKTITVLTVHDLSFVRVPEAASPRLKAYLDKVVPRSVQRADHILADSQATKDDLIALYGVAEDKVTVLLSGVDARFAPANNPSVRQKYGIGERPYLFSVGTVQPRKNYSRAIHALARLREKGHDLNFVIAGGKGWLEDPIYETIRAAGMGEYVKMIGFADDADLPALYSHAECTVFPSLYEGFGFPVLESMACGTPVVTSMVSSLPEVAGDAALMIDPLDLDALTDAIQQILEDSQLKQRLIQAGFRQAAQLSWEKSAQQLHKFYSVLLSKR